MQEIEDLASNGTLPPIMIEWSHEVRDLGNVSAHPTADQPATDANNARDIVRFLDYLLEYLYNLPEQIRRYRERHEGSG
jgi:hypothetical protein